ncbi:DUF4867 family protein [Salimicrobium sp. PL1-032A]|uniref:DUF4867 family protein n=1 Tax=Salimicrobium sp. PL1-032A TaxID=3095364 RepID=UPI00326044DF
MLTTLQKKSDRLKITHVDDPSFLSYGKIVKDFPFSAFIDIMTDIPVPEQGNKYITSEEKLDSYALNKLISKSYYGSMEIQIGYCNGKNSNLGGLEFHKGSEINVAITDMVLLLGHINDMEENSFNTDYLKAFYVPKGYAIEMYQTTLHLAPCKVTDEGFKCVVILPKDTNTNLDPEERTTDPLLFKKNKWLIAHEEHKDFVAQGAHAGIVGPNIFVPYVEFNDSRGGRV